MKLDSTLGNDKEVIWEDQLNSPLLEGSPSLSANVKNERKRRKSKNPFKVSEDESLFEKEQRVSQ